jgi:hypothetical protein
LPSFLAFESPIAIACFGLVTFLPLRPDLSLPDFISLISVSTFLPAEGEYFLAEDLLEAAFFLAVLLLVEADLFFVTFVVVGISILPRNSDGLSTKSSCFRSCGISSDHLQCRNWGPCGSPRSNSLRLESVFDDCCEGVGLKARATYQCAVDFFLA